jgi:hypothetical protein
MSLLSIKSFPSFIIQISWFEPPGMNLLHFCYDALFDISFLAEQFHLFLAQLTAQERQL